MAKGCSFVNHFFSCQLSWRFTTSQRELLGWCSSPLPDWRVFKVAITVDSHEQDTLPGRKKEGEDGKYYNVEVNCYSKNGEENKEVQGTWDYNAWNLKLENVTQGTKCKLAFSSTATDEEYKKHLEEGIALRRNTYRGKKLELTPEFYKSIEDGTFDDIYVGDYIESPNSKKYGTGTGAETETVRWLIADIDNYLHTGPNNLQNHHVTIIPAKPLTTAKMNNADPATTKCGYAGSDMVKAVDKSQAGNGDCTQLQGDTTGLGAEGSILKTIYTDYIQPDFTFEDNERVLTYSNLLTNAMDKDRIDRFGVTSTPENLKGASSGSAWYTRKLDLMSEINVYGGILASSSMLDTGIDNQQYAIFRLKPKLMYSYEGQQIYYWLKDVVSSTRFALVNIGGSPLAPSSDHAGGSYGVRPRFLIG